MPCLTPDSLIRHARLRAARVACAALLVVLSLAALKPACAQDLDDARIGGRVVDAAGALLPGASVTATLVSTNARRSVRTDAEGRYVFVELAPGAYVLRASAVGFAAEERANLVLVAGQSARVDFVLRPEGVAAETTVIEDVDAPLVDVSRIVVGGTLTRAEIESLPVSTRAPLDLILTLGGVTEEPLSTRGLAEDRDPRTRSTATRYAQTPEEAGAFALSGGAAYSNNVTIDGLDNNDDRAARERFQPSLEAVEEVQVITNQFSAEYGRASGGRVNLRTRSGTNDLRGRLFYFFKDESLDANTFNNKRLGLKRLPLQQHNPGFTLGGPLALSPKPFTTARDAAHNGRSSTQFFVAYEHERTLDTALIDALVPVEQNPRFPLPAPTTLAGRRFESLPAAPERAAELAPFIERVGTPALNHIFSARIDHSFTETHNGAFLYQFGRADNLRQFGGGLRLAEALQGRTRHTDGLAYTDNYVFSATVVNQLRAQISRLSPAISTRAGDDAQTRSHPVVLIELNDSLDSSEAAERSGTLVAGSSTLGASHRRETRWQVQDALTLLVGAHTFKLGGDVQRVRSTFVDLADATGTYTFSSVADFLASTPSRFRQRFQTASVQRNLYAGFFAQDEWRARPNLTLTSGLRYERESILRDRHNFAPRLGLAFDPSGKGKSVLRLGAGIFFNRALLRTIDDFTLGKQSIELDTDALLPTATARRAFLAANLRFPETLAPDSLLVRQFGARLSDFSRHLDPRLRTPESYQLNAGFEREVRGALVVEANYTFNRGLHLWREFNANAPVVPRGYSDFNQYLLARDFANFRDAAGTRPLYDAASAGELVRFVAAPTGTPNADAVTRLVEFGIPVSVFNLNSDGSTSALEAAHAAVNALRPDPARAQVEQLASIGNSFYHGLTIEARRRFKRRADGLAFSFRAAYTLSRLTDDGVVNTSDALRVADFRAERARSLLDRRHRFVLSGTFDTPRPFGGLRFAPILRLASGAPFNISLGGTDRNLDDVGNDRPVFRGDLRLLRARTRGAPLDPRLVEAFALPAIGQTGNLPRNAGRGPGLFLFDLNLTREFRLGESKSRPLLRPTVEIDNLLNKTVRTFGAEFINFNALKPDATPAQRQAFAETFLVPTRTLRPRSLRLGLRLDF